MNEKTTGTLPAVTLILGGARSGKTRHGMALATASRLKRLYIATGWAGDEEMAERIARHRHERDSGWTTIEEKTELAKIIAEETNPDRILLVDCLTLWLSNLMSEGLDCAGETSRLVQRLQHVDGPLILISNEVGLGLVPETPLGRAFRDEQGRLNQAVAAIAQHVVFIAAGLPLTLKPSGHL